MACLSARDNRAFVGRPDLVHQPPYLRMFSGRVATFLTDSHCALAVLLRPVRIMDPVASGHT